jgi:hypothetical protein
MNLRSVLATGALVLGFRSSSAHPAQRAASLPGAQQPTGQVDLTAHAGSIARDERRASRVPEKPTQFSAAQRARLVSALSVADRATRDPLFAAVLRRLDRRQEIAWGSTRLSALPRAQRGRPTAYLLRAYETRGLWPLANLRAYDYPNHARITSAVVACADTVKVNVDKLKRSVREIAGSLTHERAHAFCQRHRYNDRARDRCDFAYIAGDLTLIIERFRANGSRPVRVDGRVCSALRTQLREYGVAQ